MDNSSNLPEKLLTLKSRLEDLNSEDPKLSNQFYLAHWLRANGFDVEKTVEALRANRKWRKENNIDSLENEDVDLRFLSKFPISFVTAKAERPVLYLFATDIDFRGLIDELGREESLQQIARVCLKLERLILDTENKLDENTENLSVEQLAGALYVIDLKDVSIKKALSPEVLKFALEWLRVSVTYFPSISRVIRVINAPAIVRIPFKVIKPIIASRGIDLIIFGSEAKEEDLDKEIFSVVDRQQLEELRYSAADLQSKVSLLNDNKL